MAGVINFHLFDKPVHIHDWQKKGDSYELSEGYLEGSFQGVVQDSDEAGRIYPRMLVLIAGELELRVVDFEKVRFAKNAVRVPFTG